MGVPVTQFSFESIIVDHFFLKGNEFLALVNRHSVMMSCHSTNYRGAKESLTIFRVRCQKSGIPCEVFSDVSSIFMAHETQDIFKRYNIKHRVSSVRTPYLSNCGELCVKSLKGLM